MTVTAPLLIAQVFDDLAGRESAPVEPLASHLATDGADVIVLGPPESNRRYGFTVDSRVRFVPLEAMSRNDRSAGGAGLLRAIREVRLATAGADLVHAHGRFAGMLAAAGTGKRVPLVVSWYRCTPEYSKKVARFGPAARWVASRATVNCTGSWTGLQRLRAWGALDARLVPPALPADPTPLDRSEVRAALGARRRPLVVTVGGRRRAQQLVAELSMLLRRLDPRPVVIGPEDAWSGAPAADVLVAVEQSDTLLIRRALAAGVPLVIAGDSEQHDDPGDAVSELRRVAHDAALPAPADAAGIASAIERLLGDAVLSRRLAVAARRQAAGWPEEQDTIAQLVAIYRELLPG